jgi:hypothetical protein
MGIFGRKVRAGQRELSAANLNRTITQGNQAAGIQFSRDFRVWHDITGPIVALKQPPADHDFKVTPLRKTSILVSSGVIEQNGRRLVVPQTSIGGLSATDDFYSVFYRLKSTSFDPALVSTSAEIGTSQSARINEGLWNDRKQLIATVPTGTARIIPGEVRQHLSGTVEKWITRPDSESKSTGTSGFTRTLQHHPGTNANKLHKGEVTLWGIQNVQKPSANYGRVIPFLNTSQSTKNWAMRYCTPDSELTLSGSNPYGYNTGNFRGIQIEVTTGGSPAVIQDYQFSATPIPRAVAFTDHVFMRLVSSSSITRKSYVNRSAFAGWIQGALSVSGNQIVNTSTGLFHRTLAFSPDSDGIAGQNYDHAFAHPIIGDTYNSVAPAGRGVGGVWFQSIGRGSSVGSGTPDAMAIDLLNMRLHSTTAIHTLAWSGRYLRGGPWEVRNATVASPVGGALTTSGGIKADAGIWLTKGGAGAALAATDGTTTVSLSDLLAAGTFVWNPYRLACGTSGAAASATDGARFARLCNGTYAVDTNGDVNIAAGDSYMVNTIQVLTDQQAAIADVATPPGSARDTTCRLKVNEVLAMLRAHGIIAT